MALNMSEEGQKKSGSKSAGDAFRVGALVPDLKEEHEMEDGVFAEEPETPTNNINFEVASSSDDGDVVLKSLMKKSRKRDLEQRKQIYSSNREADDDSDSEESNGGYEMKPTRVSLPRERGNNYVLSPTRSYGVATPASGLWKKSNDVQNCKNFRMPDETYKAMVVAAVKKGNSSILYTIVGGFMAGMFIGFGGLAAVVIGLGSPDMEPGSKKFLFAAVFPFGLMMVYIGEPELFTGNNMLMAFGKLSKQCTWKQVWKNWIFSWIGNFIGSLFVAGLLASAGGILDKEPWREGIQKLAWHKVHEMPLYQTFVRAIGCNILVCMAIYHQFAAMDLVGKIWGIWWPIMAFVAIGFEHSVANMFFIPAGMFAGADVSVAEFLGYNLFIVSLGNMVGAVCFVSFPFHFFYACHQLPQAGTPEPATPRSMFYEVKNHPFFTPRVEMSSITPKIQTSI